MNAVKFDALLKEDGKLTLNKIPFKKGSKVEVIILESKNNLYQNLMKASQSSLKFWDNEIDDKAWNDV